MSETLLKVIEALLIPAGLLPILTLVVIWGYRNADAQSLRDRWYIAIVMALLGGVTAAVAADALFDWGLGLERWIAFGLVLLGADVVSGKWLWDFYFGTFDERRRGRTETPLEREDREVGDTRRQLQAESDNGPTEEQP